MRVLIVDDEVGIVNLLQALLPSTWETEGAHDGQTALDLFRQSLENGRPYDAVFLDIMMPGMSGREALRAIRAAEEEHGIALGDGAKTVMITALQDSRNVLGSFHRDGCDGYVVKPFSQKALQKTLRELGLLES